jgi:putative two-component system response regulator
MSSQFILAVDDDPAILDLIAELLGYEGYTVITTGEGSIAVSMARANPPALILLDLMMPQMSGWQVVAELRSTPRTRVIPVVLLSARRDLPTTAQELEITSFLEKPFELDALLNIVGQFVERTLTDPTRI